MSITRYYSKDIPIIITKKDIDNFLMEVVVANDISIAKARQLMLNDLNSGVFNKVLNVISERSLGFNLETYTIAASIHFYST